MEHWNQIIDERVESCPGWIRSILVIVMVVWVIVLIMQGLGNLP